MITKKTKGLLNHNHVFIGYGRDVPYLSNEYRQFVDGIGRQHIALYGRCDICDEKILVAKMHVKENGEIYTNQNKEDE
tara:strand:- start:1 stop:234 length:234 start_codon:yes stop_codon:yes gene_type:complete